jgi:hypothetical protein
LQTILFAGVRDKQLLSASSFDKESVEDIFVFGGKTCGFQTNGQQDW